MLMKEKEKKVVTEVIWQKKLKTMKINQLKLKIAFQLWFNRIVKKEKKKKRKEWSRPEKWWHCGAKENDTQEVCCKYSITSQIQELNPAYKKQKQHRFLNTPLNNSLRWIYVNRRPQKTSIVKILTPMQNNNLATAGAQQGVREEGHRGPLSTCQRGCRWSQRAPWQRPAQQG